MESKIRNSIDFVKGRIAFHTSRAKKKNLKPPHAAKHAETANGHKAVLEILENFSDSTTPTGGVADPNQPDLFSLNPLEVSDLPESMQEELNFSDAEILEAQIIELFKLAKKPLSINEVYVALWRQFKVDLKRNPLANRIYRMTQSGILDSVEGKKGFYKLPDKPSGLRGLGAAETFDDLL
jgi:hypothetical protein